ncbi:Uncharacterised protein [Actinobacillus pleuropneumoniae]|nr:Uncharacterised protein [Actinobacillus pleuropneumoniae]
MRIESEYTYWKQSEETAVESASRLLSKPYGSGGMSLNTEEALELLFLQAGAAAVQVRRYSR